MNTTAINPGDRLLTESELYLHYTHMTVEKSCNVGAIESYVPDDLLDQGQTCAAHEFTQSARASLEGTDRPQDELYQLVDDLQNLTEAFRTVWNDFSALKLRSETRILPEPEENAPDEIWDGYEASVRYRMP